MDTSFHEQEGVIKYRSQHTQGDLGDAIDIAEIDAWRRIMQRLGLIGQNPAKYGGLGYGNISLRLPDPPGSFLVSGTQTGHLTQLNRDHYCIVLHADIANNTLDSTGPCRPSSEALSHAVVYEQVPEANCVIHVHSPEIWHYASELHLPCTAADIRYGTPEMAAAVAQLLTTEQCSKQRVFTMRGHEDGVIAFGSSAESAAQRLITCLAEAIAIANAEIPS